MELFDVKGCLSEEGLQALVGGQLDETQRLEAAEHLAYCDHCMDRYTALLTDDVLEQPPRSARGAVMGTIWIRLMQNTWGRAAVATVAAVLALTKLHFGAMPENAKVLRITVPEDVDYESTLPDVFRAHHVTATLEKVRTESMGTLFELTYQVNLPSAVPSKALLDDLRERNGNLPILFTNPGDKDSL